MTDQEKHQRINKMMDETTMRIIKKFKLEFVEVMKINASEYDKFSEIEQENHRNRCDNLNQRFEEFQKLLKKRP